MAMAVVVVVPMTMTMTMAVTMLMLVRVLVRRVSPCPFDRQAHLRGCARSIAEEVGSRPCAISCL